MKKLLTLVLALTLIMSLAACGGSAPAASSAPAPAPAPSAAPAPAPAPSKAPASAPAPKPQESKPDLKNPEYTPEQVAAAEKFAAMTDNYNALADKVNADPNLSELQDIVDAMNMVVEAINKDDALFADPKNLTPEVIKQLEEDVVAGNDFVKEIEAMVKNYSGKKTITIPVEIINDTNVEIHDLAMTPANDTEWGANMLDTPLKAGESGVTQMTFTEDTLVWDLLAGDSAGNELTFMGIDFSEVPTTGAKLMLSATEGGMYLASFVE